MRSVPRRAQKQARRHGTLPEGHRLSKHADLEPTRAQMCSRRQTVRTSTDNCHITVGHGYLAYRLEQIQGDVPGTENVGIAPN